MIKIILLFIFNVSVFAISEKFTEDNQGEKEEISFSGSESLKRDLSRIDTFRNLALDNVTIEDIEILVKTKE